MRDDSFQCRVSVAKVHCGSTFDTFHGSPNNLWYREPLSTRLILMLVKLIEAFKQLSAETQKLATKKAKAMRLMVRTLFLEFAFIGC